tara:strand:- start:934 stop:1134 length:201 start_codon:yes stop_codon:yes gene_type:complete
MILIPLCNLNCQVIQLMPEGNQIILHCLLAFLGEVASHSDSNMMTPKNIAIVFSPGWSSFRKPDEL